MSRRAASETDPPRRPFRGIVPAAIFSLFAVVFIRFWTGVPIYKDCFQNFAAYKKWIGDAWSRGTLQGWYPWSFLGMPFAGNLEAGYFYPLNAIYALLPFRPAHALFLLVHYPMAALFMRALLRGRGVGETGAILGGLGWALSGWMVGQHAPVTMLIGATWAPLALHFAGRACEAAESLGAARWGVAAGAVLAMQVLGGDPQTALVTAVLVACLAIATVRDPRRRRAAAVAVGAAAVASLVLSAASLLPAAEMMRMTARASSIPLDEATVFSFHPGRLVELIWPSPFGAVWPENTFWARFALEGTYGNTWSLPEYLGLPVLVLAGIGLVAGRFRWRFWAASGALLFLLLAFGRHTPLYGIFHAAVPGFDRFRYPEKYFAGFAALTCALAALGIERLVEALASRPKRVSRGVGIYAGIVLAAGAIGALAWPPVVAALADPAKRGAATSGLLRWGLYAGAVNLGAAAIVGLGARGTLKPRRSAGMLVGLVVVDLAIVNARAIPAGPADTFAFRPAASGAMEPGGEPPLGAYRIFREPIPYRDRGAGADSTLVRQRLWERSTLIRNLDAMEGFEDVVGYSTSRIVDGLELLKTGLSPAILEVLGVRYVIASPGREAIRGVASEVVRADPGNGFSILRLPNARPRAYWTASAVRVRDAAEAASILASSADSGVTVVEAEGAGTEGPSPVVPATIREYAADRVAVESSADRDGWLVLSDRLYPGWTAALDGAPVPIVRANGILRAVRVPAGRHEVVFRFRSTPLRVGVGLSTMGWLGILGAAATAAARRRGRASTP